MGTSPLVTGPATTETAGGAAGACADLLGANVNFTASPMLTAASSRTARMTIRLRIGRSPCVALVQQPKSDVTPGVTVLVLPSGSVETEGVVMVEPPTLGHGVEVTPGVVIGIIG